MLDDVRRPPGRSGTGSVSTSAGSRSSPSWASSSDVHLGCLGEGLGKPLERRCETEVVERLAAGAAPPTGARPGVCATTSSRRSLVAARSSSALFVSSDRRSPRRIDVSACACLVVQFSGEPAPLELLSRNDAAQCVASDLARERSTAIDARFANCSASRRSALVNRGSGPILSCATRTPIGRSRCKRRRARGRRGAEASSDVLIHLGILQKRVDAFALPSFEHSPVFESTLEVPTARGRRALTVSRGDAKRPRGRRGMATTRADQLAQAGRPTRSSNGWRLGRRGPRRSRSATRAGATRTWPIRRTARSRLRRRPAPRATRRAPRPRR